MKRNKRILMVMMEAGNGHKVPAQAVAEEIKNIDPKAEISIIDFAKELGHDKMDHVWKDTWKWCLKHPKAYSFFLNSIEYLSLSGMEKYLTKGVRKSMQEYIEKSGPDVIFITHYTGSQVVGNLKLQNKIDVPSAFLATDAVSPFDIISHPGHDAYMLYNAGRKRDKLKRMYPGRKLIEMDFPLRQQFNRIPKISRKKLGLRPGVPVVTLVSGAEGIGGFDDYIRPFREADAKLDLMVICGRNEELKNRLEKESAELKGNFRLVPKGFITNMADHISASDIMLGKSGISFIFESLAMQKPIVFTQSMENEKGAMNFFIEQGVAWYRPNPDEACRRVMELADDRKEYDQAVGKIKRLNIRNGSRKMAELVLGLIK